MNEKKQETGMTPAGSADAASLAKIRELLFGAHKRENAARLSELEVAIAKETRGIRDDASARLESLEALLRDEILALASRVDGQLRERDAKLDAVREDIRAIAESLSERMDERLAALDSQTREQLDALSQSTQRRLDQSTEEIEAVRQGCREVDERREAEAASLRDDLEAASQRAGDLERSVLDLRERSAERVELAAFFEEIAARLRGFGPEDSV